MDLDTLMQRYFRLRQELSIAYRARPWESGRIDRLADDLSIAEREIAARQNERPYSNTSLEALQPAS